ncbi:hypothetical protein MBLNU230_g4365t1 [Neophaeotheca triangularis]
MARRKGQILPFRIPFFRIFYSTTYTILFIICLILLAITPASMIYSVVDEETYQYIFMIGGIYVLTALTAIFIYSSRLYTNRAVLAAVGKGYIPIEEGEVGKKVRKMIVEQLERSDIVAWESRPRDLQGEILKAEDTGYLPDEERSVAQNAYNIGTEIVIDPHHPPWGWIEHPGWSTSAHYEQEEYREVQFTNVVRELPNLIEARVVSLAPPDHSILENNDQPIADPTVVELLRRPETMGMREYLTQLSYLGLINAPETGERFLTLYESARFSMQPLSTASFKRLMASFSELLSGMTALDETIINEIRAQVDPEEERAHSETTSLAPSQDGSTIHYKTPPPAPRSFSSDLASPVTARTAPSEAFSPFTQREAPSEESVASVIRRTPDAQSRQQDDDERRFGGIDLARISTASLSTYNGDAGSVIHHSRADPAG